MNNVRLTLEASTAVAEKATAEVDEAKAMLERASDVLDSHRAAITTLFENYERATELLHPADLEEIARISAIDDVVVLAALGCGIAMNILPMDRTYGTTPAEIKSWWPMMTVALRDPTALLKKMRAFSWASLQGYQSADRIVMLMDLKSRLEPLIRNRRQLLKKSVLNVMKALPKMRSLVADVLQKQSNTSQTTTTATTTTTVTTDTIPEEAWDSDADDAGSGEWVKGKWVPSESTVKKDWWTQTKKNNISSTNKSTTAADIAEEKYIVHGAAKNIVIIGDRAKVEEEKSAKVAKKSNKVVVEEKEKNVEDDADMVGKFVNCIMCLLFACEKQGREADQIQQEILAARNARDNLDNVKKRTYPLRQKARADSSSCEMLEKDLTNKLKNNRLILRKAHRYREKLRVAKLLNEVSASGHTAISWAASYGYFEGVDLMLLHGAPVGYTETLLHMCATIIAITYRVHHIIASTSQKHANATESLDGNVAAVGAQIVEKLFSLRNKRKRLISQAKYLRRRHRLPIPEAAYAGKWEIIKRIIVRRMFHAEACITWVRPCPPPPFSKARKKFAKGQHLNMLECLELGTKELACGIYTPERGWIPALDPEAPYGAAAIELTPIWENVLRSRERWAAERVRIRLIAHENRKQYLARTDMATAIASGNFRECIHLADHVGCSIDTETEDGLTTLIVAAEENVAGLNHEYMRNDDGDEVLAVVYLLDRQDYRPAIDLETSIGLTALSHASFLGRLRCMEALLDRGANINYKNKNGRTPLHFAASNGNMDACRFLIERGADIDAVDNDNRSAFDLADTNGFADVMGLISQIRSGNFGIVRQARGRVIDTVPCELGCGMLIYHHEMEQHCLSCGRRTIPCPMLCGEYLLAKDVEEHLAEVCSHQNITCSLCHKQYVRYEEEKHNQSLCSLRNVLCNLGCGTEVCAQDLMAHQKICTYRRIPCPDECGREIPYALRLEHFKSECPNRRKLCPLKCCALVPVSKLEHHMNVTCPLRSMQCRWCNELRPLLENENHQNNCDRRLVPCPYKCGTKLEAGKVLEHSKSSCPNRFIPCTLGCPLKVRAIDMDNHCNHKCENRMIECPRSCFASETSKERLMLPYKQLEIHLKLACPLRPINCALCGVEVVAYDMTYHKENDCTQRIVGCRLEGCCKQLPLCHREQHERFECRRRFITCPQGCRELIHEIDLKKHTLRYCVMRYVDCPLGCGKTLHECNVQQHTESECVRRLSSKVSGRKSSSQSIRSSSDVSGAGTSLLRSDSMNSRLSTASSALRTSSSQYTFQDSQSRKTIASRNTSA